MRNETRVVYNALLAHVAKLNGVPNAAESFSVTPSVQQKLETAIQESSDFLKRINIIGVNDQEGEAIALGVNGPTASRTNTAGGNRRNPANVADLKKDSYNCKKTDFDTSFPYQLLDAWAKFPDFQVRLASSIAQRQGLDRIMIGFNGTSAAVATDRATNQLLQDVNIGWLQKIRAGAPERVLDEGAVAGKVTVGATGDYKTLDGLVFDAIQMLDPWHRKRTDLVVIVDRALLHDKQLSAVEKGAASNQEENAADEILTKGRLGGLKIEDAPFFIEGGVLITTLPNLSIYWQESARRRHLKDEPEYDRIADYQSSNDAYVIEDLGLVALDPVEIDVTDRDNKTVKRQKVRFVFHKTTTDAAWTSSDVLLKTWWRKRLKEVGVRYRGPNNCRHTYASQMLSTGVVPLDWIADQMGHTSTAMIWRHYGKWINQDGPDMIGMLENALRL